MEELIAPDGYIYVLKNDNTIYGKRISLGINDNKDNWELIKESINTNEEY